MAAEPAIAPPAILVSKMAVASAMAIARLLDHVALARAGLQALKHASGRRGLCRRDGKADCCTEHSNHQQVPDHDIFLRTQFAAHQTSAGAAPDYDEPRSAAAR